MRAKCKEVQNPKKVLPLTIYSVKLGNKSRILLFQALLTMCSSV